MPEETTYTVRVKPITVNESKLFHVSVVDLATNTVHKADVVKSINAVGVMAGNAITRAYRKHVKENQTNVNS